MTINSKRPRETLSAKTAAGQNRFDPPFGTFTLYLRIDFQHMTPDYLMTKSTKRGSYSDSDSCEDELPYYKRSRSDPGDFDDEFSEEAIIAA